MNTESQKNKGKDVAASVAPRVKRNDNESQLSNENAPNLVSSAEATPTEDNSSSKIWAKVGTFLRHPLASLLITAIFSSYLIPSWTRQWQNQQAELSTKIEILSSIDKSSIQMIMAIQYVYVGSKIQSQTNYDNAYRQWQIDKQVIRSKLQAYYPDSKLVADWNQFSEQLDKFYFISGSSNPADSKDFLTNFTALQNDLYHRKDNLNKEILNTKISIFSK